MPPSPRTTRSCSAWCWSSPWPPSSGRCSPTSPTPCSTRGSVTPSAAERDSDRARRAPMSLENVTAALTGDERPGQEAAEAAAGRIRLRAFADNRLAVAGLAVVILLTLFCFVGPLFYHTDQIHTRIVMETLKPGAGHPL